MFDSIKCTVGVLVILGFLGALDIAHAEIQSNDDLFASLDDVAKKGADGSGGFFGQIRKNSDFGILLRAMNYYEDPPQQFDVDRRNYFNEAKFDFGTHYQFSKNKIALSGWAQIGNQMDMYEGVTHTLNEDTRKRRYLEVNELYYQREFSTWDLTAGRKVFDAIGLAPLYSPSDVISPYDLNDPTFPTELGSWQLTADMTLGSVSLTASVIPVYIPTKYPSKSSRWASAFDAGKNPFIFYGFVIPQQVLDFFGLSRPDVIVTDQDTDISLKNSQQILRAKTTIAGWDAFVFAHNGRSKSRVLRQEPLPVAGANFFAEDVPIGNFGAGFSTTFGKFEFHGEGVYTLSYDKKDDSYVSYVGGSTYNFVPLANLLKFNRVEFTLDYAGEKVLKEQSAKNYIVSSQIFRKIRNDMLWRTIFEVTERLAFSYVGDLQLGGKKSSYQNVGVRYKFPNNLTAFLATEFFTGKDDTTFGPVEHNSRLAGMIEYRF